MVVTVVYIVSLICARTLEFVFNKYSNLHKGEFKSNVKCRILYIHATEVLRMMAVTWKGGCEAYVLMHLNELNPLNAGLNPICHLLAFFGAHHILHISRIMVKIADKGNHKTKKPSVELSCVVDYNEKIGTSDRSAIVVGFLA